MSKTCGPPMTLANMRENGLHTVIATCQACGHRADMQSMRETIVLPEAGRCSRRK